MDYFLHLLILAGIYSVFASSVNLVAGFTGLPVLGHVGFFAIGAYTSALLSLQLGISPWLGLLAAAASSGIIGLGIGISVGRFRDDYFAIATFGLGVIIFNTSRNWMGLTRGPMGLPGIPSFAIGGIKLDPKWSFLLLVLAVLALIVFLIHRTDRSPYGSVLRSIREDETAAKALGKWTESYKVQAFIVSAVGAGIAGSLYAHYISFISSSSFTPLDSLTVMLMVILGGAGSVLGPVLGASILVLLPELLRLVGLPSTAAAPVRQILYGILLLVLVMFRPQGLLGRYRLE